MTKIKQCWLPGTNRICTDDCKAYTVIGFDTSSQRGECKILLALQRIAIEIKEVY